MSPQQETLVRDTISASNAGNLHFPQVVQALLHAGVESYAVDYRAARTTVYWPDGATLSLPLSEPEQGIADAFSSEGVRQAIAGAQRGEVMYPAFKALTQRAGCIGYTVWLSGRHVSYYGRQGESHIEPFPPQAD